VALKHKNGEMMNIKIIVLILVSVSISAVAQLLLKMGMSHPKIQRALDLHDLGGLLGTILGNGNVWAGLSLYLLGAALWLIVLAKTELSFAYPFVSLGFLLTMVFGLVMLHESVGVARVGGTFFVILGVLLIARS
jgi:drug/metabolite transporter (DMT)-like permease